MIGSCFALRFPVGRTPGGWRDGEHIHDWMHGRFVEQLLPLGEQRVKLLAGPLERRLSEAIEATNELLRRPFEL